ncbi:hypothetical protein B0H11DRAFT_1908965 [Mycena galericulata]|nr:hypothetical protein B0H11DRAFT_1908965 [Mycena galericulata]
MTIDEQWVSMNGACMMTHGSAQARKPSRAGPGLGRAEPSPAPPAPHYRHMSRESASSAATFNRRRSGLWGAQLDKLPAMLLLVIPEDSICGNGRLPTVLPTYQMREAQDPMTSKKSATSTTVLACMAIDGKT